MAFTSLLLHDYYILPCWCTCTIIIHSHVLMMCCLLLCSMQVQNETLQVHESHTKGWCFKVENVCLMFLLRISTILEKRKVQQPFRIWNINVAIYLPALLHQGHQSLLHKHLMKQQEKKHAFFTFISTSGTKPAIYPYSGTLLYKLRSKECRWESASLSVWIIKQVWCTATPTARHL